VDTDGSPLVVGTVALSTRTVTAAASSSRSRRGITFADSSTCDSSTGVVTPGWVTHAVFYQIFPDRFAKSDSLDKPPNLEPWDSDPTPFGYKGGDLAGVRERLDYLQDLGVTAFYFNPIFQSASNHRYHTHDYYQVDPLLGGDEAFDAMLAACRRRGVRMVLDGVFNHASRGFFPFNDVLENGPASPWLDWFTVHEHPANAYDRARPPGYKAWAGLHALPTLNTDNPQVREYLMRVGEYWLRKGIDGWRLDVPFEIRSEEFWQEFRQRIKAINPEAYIVGEVWGDSRPWLQGDQFDGVMNYLTLIAAANVAEDSRRFEIPLTDPLSAQPATPTTLFATDGSPTIELTPGVLMLTLPARSGAIVDASLTPKDRA
jgi:glycosidase